MENISWEITAKEKGGRTQKVLFRLWFPLIILGIIATTVGYPALFTYHLFSQGWSYVLQQTIYTVFGVMASFIILLVINKFARYKERSYFLDNKGITISKGNKKKQYLWDEFDLFFIYSQRYITKSPQVSSNLHPQDSLAGPQRENILRTEQEIVGDIFYLKKKPKNILSKLFKSFVVVYSEPDNTSSVNEFLSGHIQKKEMRATSDLGLVFCEFK